MEKALKLYMSPGACSLAPHIVAREIGMELELVAVDLATKTIAGGGSLHALSPKGQVPLLEIAPGKLLSEGPIICQYLADRAGATQLLPAAGSAERYRVMEWQNFITSDLHKSYTVLFSKVNEEAKASFADLLHKKYRWIDAHLAGRAYLDGDTFRVADAYLFVVTRWAPLVGLDLLGFGHLQDFMRRVGARPAVQAALRAEAQLA